MVLIKKRFYLKLLHRCVSKFNFGNETKGETNVLASLKRRHLEVDTTCAESSFLMKRKAAAQCQLSERPGKYKNLINTAHGNEPLRPSCSQC